MYFLCPIISLQQSKWRHVVMLWDVCQDPWADRIPTRYRRRPAPVGPVMEQVAWGRWASSRTRLAEPVTGALAQPPWSWAPDGCSSPGRDLCVLEAGMVGQDVDRWGPVLSVAISHLTQLLENRRCVIGGSWRRTYWQMVWIGSLQNIHPPLPCPWQPPGQPTNCSPTLLP